MSTKISQEQLRKFMKEKRENLKSQKVDSPFAKYSSSGQLSCSICNVVIKNNNLWVTHIVGKLHKENLLKGKKNASDSNSKNTSVVGIKRSIEENDVSKKQKTNVFKVPEIPPVVNSTATTGPLAGYSSSDDESDEEKPIGEPIVNNTASSLPSDFFDNKSSNDISSDLTSKLSLDQKESTPTPAASNKVEILPEGFFDDPILDAKARNIEYKDPAEEEWERFKRSIAEETNLSKTIIEEDLEESILERGIHQIDEQIHEWERKMNLETLADTVKSKAIKKGENNCESELTDDDLDEDDLLDWRSKSIKKL